MNETILVFIVCFIVIALILGFVLHKILSKHLKDFHFSINREGIKLDSTFFKD